MDKIKRLQTQWKRYEKEKILTKRKYPHFDFIVELNDKIENLVFSPKQVASYSFLPLIKSEKEERRRKINETTGHRDINIKTRPICFAAHLDAILYSWYGFLLNQLYSTILADEGLSEDIIAYRSLGRPTPDFVREVCDFIKRQGECCALCFDITGFFDNIPHEELKTNWSKILNLKSNRLPDDHFKIFQRTTSYSYVSREALLSLFPARTIPVKNGRYLPNKVLIDLVVNENKKQLAEGRHGLLNKNLSGKGIPQGLPISGVLANISMLNFDKQMSDLVKKSGGLYRRYSDDIMIVSNIENLDVIKMTLRQKLNKFGFNLNEKKTEIRFFKPEKHKLCCYETNGKKSNLQYLGIEFDGTYFYIRSQSISRLIRNIKYKVKKMSWKLKKCGGNILRYRQLYKSFALPDKEGCQSFISYSEKAHCIFFPFSKIKRQINKTKIMRIIKAEIGKVNSVTTNR